MITIIIVTIIRSLLGVYTVEAARGAACTCSKRSKHAFVMAAPAMWSGRVLRAVVARRWKLPRLLRVAKQPDTLAAKQGDKVQL